MKKIVNWIRNLGIVVLLILTILSLVSRFKKTDYILSFAPMKVLSGSMEPKISFKNSQVWLFYRFCNQAPRFWNPCYFAGDCIVG